MSFYFYQYIVIESRLEVRLKVLYKNCNAFRKFKIIKIQKKEKINKTIKSFNLYF